MSMNTNILYGIGFKIPYDTDNADINSIIDYVKNHESTIRSRTDNFSRQLCAAVDANMLRQFLFDAECNVSEQTSPYAAASNIFAYETDIHPQIDFDNENEKAYIIFAQTYPWLYTDAEKNLSEDHLSELLSGLARELNLKTEVTSYEIEHFG